MSWLVQGKSTKTITEMKKNLERTQETLNFVEILVGNMADRNNKAEINEMKTR